MTKGKLCLSAFAALALCLTAREARADDAVEELTHKRIVAIGDSTGELPVSNNQWYVIKQRHDGLSPAYDNGEGLLMKRDVRGMDIETGVMASKYAKYLLRFEQVDTVSEEYPESKVYRLQWGTGRYWTDGLTTSSSEEAAALFNMYLMLEGHTFFGLNLFDMGARVDNNGATKALRYLGTGLPEVYTLYDRWWIQPVELADVVLPEEDKVDFTNLRISHIGSALSELPKETGRWYIMKQSRDGMTPAYDAGEEQPIMRAGSDYRLGVGSWADSVPQFLVRFRPTDLVSQKKEDSRVYYLQWGTGRYWSNATTAHILSTSYEMEPFNAYVFSDEGADYLGLNLYDMGLAVDNNGHNQHINLYGSGGESKDEHKRWWFYPVTLEQITHEQEEEDERLLEVINQAYLSLHEGWLFETSVDEGTSADDPIGYGLIREASQLSSPYTSLKEGSLDYLIDGRADTYWHSDDHDGTVPNGTQYIEVRLPEDFSQHGGPLLLRLRRRNDTNTNIVTKLMVNSLYEDENEDETELTLATLSLPYGHQGEVLHKAFYCPPGVTTLRLREAQTTSNNGFWHAAELQLFETTTLEDSPNASRPEQVNALNEAISAAIARELSADATDEDIEALRTAIAVFESGEVTVNWSMSSAQYGTLILPFAHTLPDGLEAFSCSRLEDATTLALDPLEGGELEANTPYIIKGAEGEYSFTAVPTNLQEEYTVGLLTGTLVSATAPVGSYVLQNLEESGLAFYSVDTEGIALTANHCLLRLPSTETQAEARPALRFPGGETAIVSPKEEASPSAKLYDLQGRPVERPTRGIYIKGNKKVIVK
ncbi:MAG: hypothetical protein LUC86_02015 [Prevotellaceae bacterium]|nr:hypothetical protein [Prevotellaceae bacterium]